MGASVSTHVRSTPSDILSFDSADLRLSRDVDLHALRWASRNPSAAFALCAHYKASLDDSKARCPVLDFESAVAREMGWVSSLGGELLLNALGGCAPNLASDLLRDGLLSRPLSSIEYTPITGMQRWAQGYVLSVSGVLKAQELLGRAYGPALEIGASEITHYVVDSIVTELSRPTLRACRQRFVMEVVGTHERTGVFRTDILNAFTHKQILGTFGRMRLDTLFESMDGLLDFKPVRIASHLAEVVMLSPLGRRVAEVLGVAVL